MSIARVLLIALGLAASPAYAELHALVISGLGGEEQYERKFQEQAARITTAAAAVAGNPKNVVELSGAQARKEAVERELRALASRVKPEDQVLVVFIGHGSFDGEEYRFNQPGPDLTGTEIGRLLDKIPARDQLVVNATSASGAVAEKWQRPRRVVITATRSGNERNATRFAEYWVQALGSEDADRDKNGLITAAEAFEFASRRVQEYFKSELALATEHAQIKGGSPGRFLVARLGDAMAHSTDPQLMAMLDERSGIEGQLEELKARKADMAPDAYYDELEKVLVALARLQRRIDARQAVVRGTAARGPDASAPQ